MFLWSPSVCSANGGTDAVPDGGQAADARSPGGSTDAQGGDHMDGGCACATHSNQSPPHGALATLAIAAMCYLRRRR